MSLLLEEEIKKYAKAYYEGEALISDEEFDKLVYTLKQTNPNSYILTTPGWGYIPEPGKLKERHLSMKIGSLDKERLETINKNVPLLQDESSTIDYIITPKLDGNSIVCYYYNGKLSKILSRGDGVYGINITQNLYQNIPNKINNYNNYLIAIRGEAILTYEDFSTLDEGSNPRNKCAGLIQSKNSNPDDLRKIRFIPYSIVSLSSNNSELKWKYKTDQFKYFKENNFEVIPYEQLNWDDLYNKHLIRKNVDKNLYTLLDGHTCPVDGIVISKNECIDYSFNIDKEMFVYAIGNESIAYKYPDEKKETTIVDINWKMSSGGKFIPVLKIKEIEIDGIKINNVTANNYKWLVEMECGVGATVNIRRANECIPNITEVINKSKTIKNPRFCYYCSSALTLDEYKTHLICPNMSCEAKDIAIIYKIWNYIKPDGASDACFQILLDKIKNTNILYSYEHSQIITRCCIYLRNSDLWDKDPKNHYFKLVKQALINYTNMKATIPMIIKMANIPSLGETIGNRIESNCEYSVALFISYVTSNIGFPNNIFKYELLNKYLNNLKKVCYIWENKIVSNSNSVQYRIAVTGKLSKPRTKWYKELEQYGVKKSGVTKDCDYVVCNSVSDSSTYKKAIKLGIPILTEDDFYKVINYENKV